MDKTFGPNVQKGNVNAIFLRGRKSPVKKTWRHIVVEQYKYALMYKLF